MCAAFDRHARDGWQPVPCMSDLSMLTRYKAWADGALLAAVRALPEAELTAPQPIVFGSLLRTLHHVQAMDAVWRAHLLGEPHGYATRDPEDCPALDALAARQAELDRWYVDYAEALSDTADETVAFEFIGGGRGALSRREILLHVVNHATYHRGHVADMLYRFGVAPPTTDLPVFLRTQAH
jgi:uncharacterized damage-inducible protein DinB